MRLLIHTNINTIACDIIGARFPRKILTLETILNEIRNSTAHSRYWNYQREERLNLEFAISWKDWYLEVEVRRGIPDFTPMCEGWKNEILAPGRISRQIGASVSPTFIFRNSCARYPRDTVAVKAISPQISRCVFLGCIFLPIYSEQPISLPDFTRPFPRSVFTKKLVNVSDSHGSRYEGIVGWYPYIDPKFRTNRNLSGKRRFPQFCSLFAYHSRKIKIKNVTHRVVYVKISCWKISTCWIFSYRKYFLLCHLTQGKVSWNYSERFPIEIIPFFSQLSYHGNSDNDLETISMAFRHFVSKQEIDSDRGATTIGIVNSFEITSHVSFIKKNIRLNFISLYLILIFNTTFFLFDIIHRNASEFFINNFLFSRYSFY